MSFEPKYGVKLGKLRLKKGKKLGKLIAQRKKLNIEREGRERLAKLEREIREERKKIHQLKYGKYIASAKRARGVLLPALENLSKELQPKKRKKQKGWVPLGGSW